MDLRPDPARIRDTDDLLAALCDYRAWAGDPSYRKMAITAGQMVTATTMREALVGDRLPPLATVTAVLRGCGAAGEYEERFAAAWQRCSGAGDGAP
jgi:hypothetical protein